MSPQEFSNEWDILISQYSPTIGYGIVNPLVFDDYEKSVCLTVAQEELIKTLYRGANGDNGFEQNEELRSYLQSLVIDDKVSPIEVDNELLTSNNSYAFILEDSTWFIVYESAVISSENKCLNNKQVQVVPVRHDEYNRIRKNPFRGPNSNRVLRLDIQLNGMNTRTIELISNNPISTYHYRYIKKPSPIIVSTLEDITINGEYLEQTSILPESLHRQILELAVQKGIENKLRFNSKAEKA